MKELVDNKYEKIHQADWKDWLVRKQFVLIICWLPSLYLDLTNENEIISPHLRKTCSVSLWCVTSKRKEEILAKLRFWYSRGSYSIPAVTKGVRYARLILFMYFSKSLSSQWQGMQTTKRRIVSSEADQASPESVLAQQQPGVGLCISLALQPSHNVKMKQPCILDLPWQICLFVSDYLSGWWGRLPLP